ncbi:hypothetical protein AN643_04200 [Candidatus Epulonipiscioides saccharophilum]|nr:hypothetical protein AN643_04200 [Epulopiscium sp. SCG-B10WGA-EpuloB]
MDEMDKLDKLETFLLDMAAKCKTLNNENKDWYEIMDYVSILRNQTEQLTGNNDLRINELKSVLAYLVNEKQAAIQENILLDSIVKSLLELSDNCILGVINKCFDKNYRNNVKIDYMKNNFVDPFNNFAKTETDVLLKINEYYHHIEIQTLNDTAMPMRLIKYALNIAERQDESNTKSKSKSKKNNYNMPLQAVIFLEQNNNILDQALKISFESGNEWNYSVNTIRFWKYDIESLISEKMYCLLPLVVFKYRKEFQSIVKSKKKNRKIEEDLEKKANQLKETAEKVALTITQLANDNIISHNDMRVMLLALTNLTQHLIKKFVPHSIIGEEVGTMVKDLYDPEVEKKGKIEGQIEILYKMKMNEKEISQKLKLPIEKVKEIIKELKSNGTIEEETFDMAKDLYDTKVEKRGIEKGIAIGQVKILYGMKMDEIEISKQLKMPIDVVKEIIEELKL